MDITEQNQIMNSGDSNTLDSKFGDAHSRLTSTMKSLPLSSQFNTCGRNVKYGNTLNLLTELLNQNVRLDGLVDFKGSLPIIPINDLRGEEASAYSREECVLRRSLAALYRLIDSRGWTHSIYNHISARSPDNRGHFLINPFGLLYHEVQASSLIKIDEEGNVVQQGSTIFGVNKAGWTLHSALHSARRGVNCIVHVHLPDVIAVSCIRAGLLPVSPEAMELLCQHGVRYHDYRGILVDEAERVSIQEDLGLKAKILFLRNHGVVVAASSVPEGWYLIKRVVTACQTQMRMLQLTGGASLLSDLKDAASHLTDDHPESDGPTTDEHIPNDENSAVPNGVAHSDSGDVSWSPAELEFEAEMRVLDSAGFRTGHIYRQPNLLRRTHPVSSWAGGTLGDQATGAELLTTDFSATEFSAVDDIAAAEAAGAKQVAKIVDSVKVNRMKSTQRNQWLSDKPFDGAPGLVTSSLIASPGSMQSANFTPMKARHFEPTDSPPTTPVRRPIIGELSSPSDSWTDVAVAPQSRDQSATVPRSAESNRINKSATLPAKVQHQSTVNSSASNTLECRDDSHLVPSNEKPKLDKKAKKKGSFRMPSFSRKKKQ